MRKLLIAAAFASISAAAQSRTNAAEIVKRINDVYRGVSQYELVMETSAIDRKTGKPESSHVRIALKAPDKYRMEQGPTGGKVMEMIIVLDGTNIWFYDPQENKYASLPASALGDALPDELEADGIDFAMIGRFRESSKPGDTAEFLRDEEIEVQGEKIACQVVSVLKGATEYIWWVDKNYRVLREDHDGSTIVFTKISLGGPVPDELFKFEPPPGAQKGASLPIR